MFATSNFLTLTNFTVSVWYTTITDCIIFMTFQHYFSYNVQQVHLSIVFFSFLNQNFTQYSSDANGCFPKDLLLSKWSMMVLQRLSSIFINPLPDDKILDCSKLKQIADDFLKYIYNGKYVPYTVEKITNFWEDIHAYQICRRRKCNKMMIKGK